MGRFLANLGIIDRSSALCPLCDEFEELVTHVLFSCLIVWTVSMSIFQWRGVVGVLHDDPMMNIMTWRGLERHKKFDNIWN